MKCAYHPEVDAIGVCVNCGRLICAECKVVLREKIYCNPCADKLSTGVLITQKASNPNWFERHLNWTAVLTWVALYPISFLASFIVGLVVIFIDPYISDEVLETLGYLAGIAASLAWLLTTNGWILRKKARSIWWVLILFVPFGWIVFLSLENKNIDETLDIRKRAITKIKRWRMGLIRKARTGLGCTI